MKPQAFQPGELRDEHDKIIRAGAYGKKTPFVSSDNNAILDYIMNNFDALYAQIPNGKNYVKSVNNITPDSNGNVTINLGSGGGTGGTNITVDSTLSSASTNPVQNKVIYVALSNKLDKNGTATYATCDSSGNIISNTYARKSDLSGYVKSINNVKPDSAGNVNISTGGTNVTPDLTPYMKKTADSDLMMGVYKLIFGRTVISDDFRNTVPMFTIDATGGRGVNIKGPSVLVNGIPIATKTDLSDKLDKTGTAAAATKATQDGAGNVIETTYIKTVNNLKPDASGNVNISGGGGGSGDYLPLTGGTVTGGITATNFQTGTGATSYFQCRKFRGEGDANSYYHAIDFGYSGHDSVDFYEYDPNWNFYKCPTGTKSGAVLVGNINGNGWNGGARLTGAPTAPTAPAGTNTTQIATTEFVQAAIPTNVSLFSNDAGYIKSVNNIKPDLNGNVNISTSSGGGGRVSTSVANTWTAQQNFQRLKFNFESFATSRISGTYDSPATSVATYNVTGALTLDMSTLAGMISNGDTSIFTAYIASNGSYALSITNSGTLKHAGSAADLAITASGLLLNIFLTKNASGVVTSIAQATKLS